MLGKFLRNVAKLNQEQRNFRIFGPDETLSNLLGAVFEITNRQWDAREQSNDEFLAPTGRVLDSMLSEHQCEGWLEGYLLTGRHGLFNSYEAFIRIVDSMFSQHAKWLKVTSELPWRRKIASLNYLLASHVWQQDHNGFTHQDPGFLDHVINKKADIVRVYLPPDANCLLGVKVKMVTGDALAIARETAKTTGNGHEHSRCQRPGRHQASGNGAVSESIEKADGFAQVFPEHKFHIVDVLQKRGHIVGMTGDGVNDAPALKKADCGIAVSGATDAARAAASIVLLTPGLSVIIDAIKESRRIFQRMNSYAIYRIAETLRVLFFMTLAILIFNFYPVTAVMIVMLALLNDGAILSIAYDNVHYKDQARSLEHAHGAGHLHGPGPHRGRVRVWPVLSRRARLSSRPRTHPDADVLEAVRGRTSDDFPDTHARSVLVHTPRADSMDRRARHANRGDFDRSLWPVHDAPGLGLGTLRLGLCSGLVLTE